MLQIILPIALLVGLPICLLPSIVAIKRRHNNCLQITLLNILLGWSFIAWVAALIWSTTDNINYKNKIDTSLIILIIFCFLIAIGYFFYNVFIIPIQESNMSNSVYTEQGKAKQDTDDTVRLLRNMRELQEQK
jgi:hypothetical protein